jgi:hypothetical protein
VNPKLFISYSRQQTPFVEQLAADFENSEYPFWLDYHNLVPARPWFDQIKSGVTESDAFLLVISDGSVSSPNVEPEWRLALELKERIILLIFEAVSLPPELQNCEWVDFRGEYKKSLEELKKVVNAPATTVESAAPQTGFKAPKRFWLSLALSIFILFASLTTWWTLIVPFILIPLPWQIYKRNYRYTQITPILLLMPVFLLLTSVSLDDKNLFSLFISHLNMWWAPATLASWALWGLLSTPGMRLRVRPEAANVRFKNPLVVDVVNPRSVLFTIDYAPEDGRYAQDITRGLEKHGHCPAKPDETPEAVFVLLSTYKKSTTYDPDHQAVYPVLLQAVDDIDPALQRIQWIDFRKGIRNIDKLAKLLPEPQRLLKALAVAPTGMQEVMPLSLTALQYLFFLMGFLGIGSLLFNTVTALIYYFQGALSAEYVKAESLFIMALNIAVLFWFVTNSVTALQSRSGGASSAYALTISAIFVIVLVISNINVIFVNPNIDQQASEVANHTSTASIVILAFIFPVAILVVTIIILFRWKELYRWLPRRQNDHLVTPIERALLLYTPMRPGALVFHIIFHVGILVLLVILQMTGIIDALHPNIFLCCWSWVIPSMLLIYWLARRISK